VPGAPPEAAVEVEAPGARLEAVEVPGAPSEAAVEAVPLGARLEAVEVEATGALPRPQAAVEVTDAPREAEAEIDATAPIAIPCRRRVRDSPRRIDGTCMAFRPSIGGEAPYAARTATEAGANGTSRNAVRRYCCRWEGADFDTLLFFGSSRTNCCPLDQ
jgi:hypothetical protein